MEKSTGYKGMLRDRMPLNLDFALRWCKAKDKWINLVYEEYIKPLEREKRSVAVKRALRLRPAYSNGYIFAQLWRTGMKYNKINKIIDDKKVLNELRMLDFRETIPWSKLDEEETNKWNAVATWVSWFRNNGANICNTYEVYNSLGESRFDIQIRIIKQFLSSILPEASDSDEVKERKNNYVDKLSDYLIVYAEKCSKKL